MDKNLILELDNVGKVYSHPSGNNITALENISLNIFRDSITAIYGTSGSGKTTLLKIAALIEIPTTGSVIFNGQHTEEISAKKRPELIQKNIGFILQRSNLLKYLNVLENVMLPMKKNNKSTAINILDSVGFHQYKECPENLTILEQQKVALARALINEPLLILADEPTGDLNKKDSKEFLKLLKSFKNNSSIMIATDNPQYIKYGDITPKIENGKLTQD